MKTVTKKYYKTLKNINFNDNFNLSAGTTIMLNFVEGEMLNVQIEENKVKRIFWIHQSEVRFMREKKERWSKQKLDQYNTDLDEKWMETKKSKIK